MRKILLALVIVILIAGAAFLVWKTKGKKDLNQFLIQNVLVTTELTQPEAEAVVGFVRKAVKEEFIPKEIILREVILKQNQGTSSEFRTSWNKDGQFISLLYVRQKDTKVPYYFRLWVLPPAQKVDEKTAGELLAELFNQDFLLRAGEIKCRQVALPEGAELTECGSLKTQESGDMEGVTVRAPVPVEDTDEKAAAVSVCLVSGQATSSYPSALCD